VAAGINGGFVVVWDSYGSAGSDGDYGSIHGQRYEERSGCGAGIDCRGGRKR